ncbi:MAG TPA: sigma-70 family RNA polymerase sigma factor [Bacteroidetes bacterium]|nr:sigma-70 family RNA polymerase sigma factor [Bacteroidota bacterium]
MGNRQFTADGISDPELVKGCLERKEYCQEVLYKRYFSFAMSVCIRYTGDQEEAMETVNDSFMKVLENLENYDSSKPFKPWYAKILINTAIDRCRKNLRHSAKFAAGSISEADEPETEMDMGLTVSDILELYRHLPEQYKMTFNLYEIDGYSHEEIAQMLGTTVSTSRSNLARAKKMLRELYRKKFESVSKRP